MRYEEAAKDETEPPKDGDIYQELSDDDYERLMSPGLEEEDFSILYGDYFYGPSNTDRDQTDRTLQDEGEK